MTPAERIEMIRLLELMKEHKNFSKEVGLTDSSSFQEKKKASKEDVNAVYKI